VGPEGVSSGGQLILAAAGNLTLAGGAVVTGLGAGPDAVVLAAGSNFVNNSTNAAVLAPNGRWLIFSTNPANSVTGGLAGSPLYNQSFDFAHDSHAPIANSGNRFVYSFAPKLTVTPNAVSKTYNGTTQTSDGFFAITGFVNGDDPNLAYSGMAAISGSGRNAGSYMLTASLGTLASDYGYGFNFGTSTLTIGQSALTVQASSTFKIYDGTTTSTQGPLVTGAVYAGDTRAFSQAYASKNAGNFLLVTPSGMVNDGNGGNNYSYTYISGTVGTIGTRTVTLAGGTRSYDGTDAVAPSLLSVANKVTGDDVSFTSGTGFLTSKNAGVEQIASLGSLALGGADAANYSLPFSPAGSVTITQVALTVMAAANTKTYDGTTGAAATPTVTSGTIFGGDNGSFSESYATQHTGSGLTLTPAGAVADGNGGANYAVTFTPVTTGVINALPVVLAGTRTYDATTAANFSILSVANAVAGDTVNVASGSATLADKVVGSEAITSFGTLALGNNTFGDYTLTGATGSVNITALGVVAVTISGMKVYDGTTDAPAADLMITDVVSGDMVSLTGTGVLSSKNVGVRSLTSTGGTLTGLGLTGADAANYTLSGGSGSVAITPAALTVTAAANSKTYDGTATAAALPTITGGSLKGSDSAAFIEAYGSKNAGNTLTLTPSGVANDGNGGGNYAYSFVAANVGTITPLAVTLSGMRTYDGTAIAAAGILSITDVVAGDTVNLASGTATLTSRNAGPEAITSAGTLALGGTDAGNYTLSGFSGSVTVNKATLTIAAVSDSRVYNGTTSSAGAPNVTGLQTGDGVSGTAQAFSSKDVQGPNGSTLSVTAYTVNDGNSGGNYSVSTQTAIGTITPLAVTLTGSRQYDGTTGASSGILSIGNNLDGVNLALTGTGTLASKNAGSEALTSTNGALTGLSLVGIAANDYTLAGASGSVTVGQAPLTIQAATTFKIYDGTTSSATLPLVTGTVYGTDTRAFTQAYAGKNAGNFLTVTPSGSVNDGNGGANYSYSFIGGTVGTIGTRSVTLGGSRTYDGTASAAAGILSVANAVMGDDVSLASGAATLQSRNAGSELVTSFGTLALGGTAAANYNLTGGNLGSVTINKAPITVTAATNSKTYDGTATASATPTVTSGALVGGDTGSFSESYANGNAGTGLTLTPSGSVTDGNGGNNYAVTFAPVVTGTINPRAISVIGMRAYDGTANVDSSILTITNDIDGANLTLSGSGTLSGQHVGAQTITGPGTFALNGSAKNNYTIMGASSAVTITARAVTLSGTRAYDATTGVVAANLTVANAIGMDNITVTSGSATLAGKNVGDQAISSLGTLALGNNGAGDYTLTGASGSVNITPATLSASLAGTVSKTYDGTNAITNLSGASNYMLAGVQGSDIVSFNAPSIGTYDTKDVGAGKMVTVTGLIIGGAAASNYVLASTTISGAIGTINAATLTYAATAASQSYGTANSSFAGTVTGFAGGDTLMNATTGTASFTSETGASTNIGSYGIFGSGLTANSGNYVFTQAAGNATALTITPFQLTAGLTGTVAKTYDGTAAAVLAAGNYTLSAAVNGDVVTLNNPISGTYDTKNAGTGKTVTVTGLSIGGAKAGNYVLASISTSGAVGTINAATLTAGLTGTVSKTYDATLAATLAAANYTLTGVVGGDAVTLNNPTSGTYNSKNVGTEKTVSVSGLTLTGAGAGNYSLASASASAAIGTINAATLTYAANAASQSYGSANTAFGGTVTGFVGGETLGTATTGTAAFTSATGATSNIGSYAITGSGLTANSGNYVFTQGAGNATALTITPVQLTASLTGTVSRTYDGTAAATLAANNYTLSPTVNGDVITLNNPASGTFDSKNVGTGKTVSAAGLALGGAKAGNYVLASTSASGAIGTITAATLTASLTGTVSKTYDGTAVAALAAANYGLQGVIGGDAVTLNNPVAGTYDSKNVGTAKTVSVSGLTLGGAGAGNYVLASGSVAGAIGAINPAVLNAGLTGTVSKTYDGTAAASLAAGNYTLSGVVTGESVTLNNPAGGSFDNANAGSGKAVSVTGLAISGPGSTNYTLFSSGASANIGLISPKSVTYSVADTSSNFGIAPVLGAATLTGVLAADTVTGTVGLFNGPNIVAANALTPVGFYTERVTGLIGAAAGNYAIAATGNVNGTLTVNTAVVTPGQIINPNVTPPISQTIAQANLQLTTFGATSFVVANGTAATATLSAPGPGGGRVLTITTMVGNIPVTYTLPVADQGGGGGILGAYSSFDDLLAAAQTTQQASN
jgi:hypothetical protein